MPRDGGAGRSPLQLDLTMGHPCRHESVEGQTFVGWRPHREPQTRTGRRCRRSQWPRTRSSTQVRRADVWAGGIRDRSAKELPPSWVRADPGAGSPPRRCARPRLLSDSRPSTCVGGRTGSNTGRWPRRPVILRPDCEKSTPGSGLEARSGPLSGIPVPKHLGFRGGAVTVASAFASAGAAIAAASAGGPSGGFGATGCASEVMAACLALRAAG